MDRAEGLSACQLHRGPLFRLMDLLDGEHGVERTHREGAGAELVGQLRLVDGVADGLGKAAHDSRSRRRSTIYIPGALAPHCGDTQ